MAFIFTLLSKFSHTIELTNKHVIHKRLNRLNEKNRKQSNGTRCCICLSFMQPRI